MNVTAIAYSFVSLMAVSLIIIVSHFNFSTEIYYSLQLHSTVEAVGGLAALFLSHLLSRKEKQHQTPYIHFVICGLIGMGTLDLFHAIAPAGDAFTWLRSAATFVGGLFTACVWLSGKVPKSKVVARLPIIIFITAIVSGFAAVLLPDAVPEMVAQGGFTLTARLLNVLGGGLFMIALAWFVRLYVRSRNNDALLFGLFCLLFGSAGLLFQYSQSWNLEWWLWHVIRLCGYLLAIYYVFENLRRSEQALQKSEVRYRHLVDYSSDVIYVISNTRGGIFYSNRTVEILGYTAEELIEGPFIWHDSIHPEDRPAVDAAIDRFAGGNKFEIEYRIKDRQGNWRRILDRFITKNRKGDEIVIEGLASDITERRLVEAAKWRSETLLDNIIEHSPFSTWISDETGTLIRLNQACRNLLNLSDQDVVGTYNLLHDNIVEEQGFMPQVRSVFEEGLPARFELRYDSSQLKHLQLSGGAEVVLDVTIFPVLDALGRVSNAIIQHNDITAQRRAEESLVAERDRAQMYLDVANVMIGVLDAQGDVVLINRKGREILGYETGEIVGKNWFDLLMPKNLIQEVKGVFESLMAGSVAPVEYYENPVLRKGGGERLIAFNNNCITDEEGHIVGIIFSGKDITERKQTELALLESEEKYRNLVDNTPVSVYTTTVDGEILFANDAMVKLLGFDSPEELMEKNITGFYVNYDDRKILLETLRKKRKIINFETRYLTKSGTPKDILLSAVQIDGRLSGTIMDITELKRLEQDVRQSEMFLNEVGRIGQIGGWEFDFITQKPKWTAGTYDLFEIDRNDPLPGRDEIFELHLPEYRPMVIEAVRALVEDGTALDYEARLRTTKGNIKWCRALGHAVREKGVCIRTYGTFQDITERKQVEMQVREYADTQAVLLRELNHRVKNNLAILIGMLHKEEDLAVIKGNTLLSPLLHDLEGRIRGLLTVHNMLSSSNWQPILLSTLCKQIISGILKAATVDVTLTIPVSKFRIDSNQAHHLSMVINELTTNSLKYALNESAGARIDVDISEGGGKVLVVFRDNGPGYPEGIISGTYAGASIGFDIVTGIVKKSLGGSITFRNDNGAVAEIRFDKTDLQRGASP